MAQPKVFRDPVHGQIRFAPVDLAGPLPARGAAAERHSWLLRRLIDCPEVQRLRHTTQLGLAKLVFHGAEHSRFSHSMGSAFLAGEMYDRVVRNTGDQPVVEDRLAVCAAALLHDVGHCPFSHTLEDILAQLGVTFHHERLGARLVTSPETGIGRVLAEVDPAFPRRVAAYIDRTARADDHWTYKLVASQLDADRLDYLLRDKYCAGLQGHGFDLPRLLDMLQHLGDDRLAVHRGAIAQVEAYLLTLDHMYRMVYFHHATRAAAVLLGAVIGRATELHRAGDDAVFPRRPGGTEHPLAALLDRGEAIDLGLFTRLGDHHVWTLIDGWREHPDPVLADLAARLFGRRLPKTYARPGSGPEELEPVRALAEELTLAALPHVSPDTVSCYVTVDGPSRTSYRRYDWRTESHDEAIWLVGGDDVPRPIGDEAGSSIVTALKQTKYFHRLMFPAEIRPALEAALGGPGTPTES